MSKKWQEIYEQAIYVVTWQEKEILFKIDEFSDKINQILLHHQAKNFAFITAYNPFSEQKSEEENQTTQTELITILDLEKYVYLEGFSTNNERTWNSEKSVFILDISPKNALALAHKFNQNAFVYGKLNDQPKLVWSKKSSEQKQN